MSTLLNQFEVWATVPLGCFSNKIDLLEALKKSSKKVSSPAQRILESDEFKCTPHREYLTEQKLIWISPADMGFDQSVSLSDFYCRVTEEGFTLCPIDIAPMFHLQNERWIGLEALFFASEPLGEAQAIFCVVDHQFKNTLALLYLERGMLSKVNLYQKHVFVLPEVK